MINYYLCYGISSYGLGLLLNSTYNTPCPFENHDYSPINSRIYSLFFNKNPRVGHTYYFKFMIPVSF